MSHLKMSCHMCSGWTGGCNGSCNRHPAYPYQPGFAEVTPKGCVCPPTSEKTCQRWDCGRKTPTSTTTGGTFSGKLADANSKFPPQEG
jgi:hypothetical protein